MRQFVNRLDQTAFVRSMNQQFTTLSRTAVFATAVVTTFFAPTNRLVLCNAGHPSPLLYRADSVNGPCSKAWRSIPRQHTMAFENLPLGIEDLTDYEQFAADLDVGDLVFCYSDSLIESKNTRETCSASAGCSN